MFEDVISVIVQRLGLADDRAGLTPYPLLRYVPASRGPVRLEAQDSSLSRW